MREKRARLRIFATHPVQYHVPLWRSLSNEPELDVKVFYFNDQSVRGGVDVEFGLPIKWDVDLLDGYEHEFLSRDADLNRPASIRIKDPDALLRREAPHWVLFAGYTHGFERQLVRRTHRHGAKLLMRGEYSDLLRRTRPPLRRWARDVYLRWFYAHADRFGVIGEQASQHLTRLGVGKERQFSSPYAVDESVIALQRSEWTRELTRERLGIPDARFMFVISGKVIPRKNPFAVLDALRRMKHLEQAGLISLGTGELMDAFNSQARALLGDRFIAPGFVNQTQLGRFFLAADALLMPSLHETWGLVVNEAMHFSLPCIVSDQVGCSPDLIVPGRTGYTYDSRSNSALRDCMERLMDDPERARRMGDHAYQHVQGYTVDEARRGIVEALGLTNRSNRAVQHQRDVLQST